jgi:hypothetical protein
MVEFELVKVQLPLSPGTAEALIYNQDRSRMEQYVLTAAERRMMGGTVRAFFRALWATGSNRWTLIERVADQDW